MSEIQERKLHQILNPYQIDQKQMVRTQIWVAPDDKSLLNSVYPIRGVETLLLSGIYKRLCAQLRAEKLTSYSPENARRAHEIITSYITTLPTDGAGLVQDVARGTDEVSQSRADSADLAAHIRKAAKGRQRNDGGKRGSGKKAKGDAG